MLFLDLDNFKTVNDSLGHSSGDEVLVAVARRLEACLRASDTATRLGGDEFAVLLEGLADPDQAAEVADLVIAALGSPSAPAGSRGAASVGIAFGPRRSNPAGSANADLAMYSAKRNGKESYDIYRPQLYTAAGQATRARTDLRSTPRRVELAVHYQPIVVLSTGEVVGYEALVRWHHPQRGIGPRVVHPARRGDRPDRGAGSAGPHRGVPGGQPVAEPPRATTSPSASTSHPVSS